MGLRTVDRRCDLYVLLRPVIQNLSSLTLSSSDAPRMLSSFCVSSLGRLSTLVNLKRTFTLLQKTKTKHSATAEPSAEFWSWGLNGFKTSNGSAGTAGTETGEAAQQSGGSRLHPGSPVSPPLLTLVQPNREI